MKEIVKSIKKQNGITLVVLVITIIVLLLLAVVSINIVQNSGLIEKTKLAKEEHRASAIQEQIDLLKNEQEIAKQNNETEPSINELIDKLQEQKLITAEEKNTIMQTGNVTIGSKEIIFSKDAILPQGYKRCEYLENTGFCYVDTKLALGNNFRIVGAYSQTNEKGLWEQPIVSIYNATNGWWNFFVRNDNTTRLWANEHHIMPTIYTMNEKHDFEIERITNQWSVTVDDEKINWVYTPPSANLTTLKLLTRGDCVNSDLNNASYNRLYETKVYNSDILIGNFIPCLDSNNRPCMYDTVSGQTFYNQGTGEFIAGPVIE